MRVINLKCDGLREAIQVSPDKLFFSWNLESEREGVFQSAYQLIVKREEDVLWDTGKVSSEACLYIPYEGKGLAESSRYEWLVRVWDQSGRATDFADR